MRSLFFECQMSRTLMQKGFLDYMIKIGKHAQVMEGRRSMKNKKEQEEKPEGSSELQQLLGTEEHFKMQEIKEASSEEASLMEMPGTKAKGKGHLGRSQKPAARVKGEKVEVQKKGESESSHPISGSKSKEIEELEQIIQSQSQIQGGINRRQKKKQQESRRDEVHLRGSRLEGIRIEGLSERARRGSWHEGGSRYLGNRREDIISAAREQTNTRQVDLGYGRRNPTNVVQTRAESGERSGSLNPLSVRRARRPTTEGPEEQHYEMVRIIQANRHFDADVGLPPIKKK